MSEMFEGKLATYDEAVQEAVDLIHTRLENEHEPGQVIASIALSCQSLLHALMNEIPLKHMAEKVGTVATYQFIAALVAVRNWSSGMQMERDAEGIDLDSILNEAMKNPSKLH